MELSGRLLRNRNIAGDYRVYSASVANELRRREISVTETGEGSRHKAKGRKQLIALCLLPAAYWLLSRKLFAAEDRPVVF